MNDWWNDPPDNEPKYAPWVDGPEPENLEEVGEPPPEKPLCPHGNKWGECDHCDFEGDIAFDAERERRLR